MATPWVVTDKLGQVTGEVIDALKPLAQDLIDAWKSGGEQALTTLLRKILNSANASDAEKTLVKALLKLEGANLFALFETLGALSKKKKVEDRTIGWADLQFSDDWKVEPDDLEGDLTLKLKANNAIAAVIHHEDDGLPEDRLLGPSAHLLLRGNLRLGADVASVPTHLPQGSSLGFGIEAGGMEEAEWRYAITDQQELALTFVLAALAAFDDSPADFDKMRRLFQTSNEVGRLHAVALRRERNFGANGKISVPFQVNLATVTVSGSAKYKSSTDLRVTLQHDREGIHVDVKDERINVEGGSLGLGISVGFSAFDVDAVKALVGALGEVSNYLEKVDGFLERGESFLKPGTLVKKKLEKAVKKEIGEDPVTGLLGTWLDVKPADVSSAVAEELAGWIDDLPSVFNLTGDGIVAALSEKVDSEVIAPAQKHVNKALEKAGAEIEARLNGVVDKLNGPDGKANQVLDGIGIPDHPSGEAIKRVRAFLNGARSRVDNILSAVGAGTQIKVGLNFSAAREDSKKNVAVAKLLFKELPDDGLRDALSEHYGLLVNDPGPTLAGLVGEKIAGLTIEDLLISDKRGRKETKGWTFSVAGLDVGLSFKEFWNSEVIQTVDGAELVIRAGAEGTSLFTGRTLELSKVARFTDDDNTGDFSDKTSLEDGIFVRFADNNDESLDAGETEDIMSRLIDIGAVTQAQAENATAAVREIVSRQRVPGSVKLDLSLSEMVSDKLCRRAASNSDEVKRRLAEVVLKHNRVVKESLSEIYFRESRRSGYDGVPLLLHDKYRRQRAMDALRNERQNIFRQSKDELNCINHYRQAVLELVDALAATGHVLASAAASREEAEDAVSKFKKLDEWVGPRLVTSFWDKELGDNTVLLFKGMMELAKLVSDDPVGVLVTVAPKGAPAQQF